MSTLEPRLDVIVFGATGYTGNYAARQVAKFAQERSNFTWAIAGRDRNKLEMTLKQVEKKTGTSLKDVQVVVANVKDNNSLSSMAQRTRVVINCVGPYTLHGEPVVKACIRGSAHYVDVTAELPFVKRIRKKFDLEARKNNVYIIHSCGFASIPSELGVVFAQQNFQGQINSIETYLQPKLIGPRKAGPQFNIGTWDSIVSCTSITDVIGTFWFNCLRAPLPPMKPTLMPRMILHRNPVLDLWALPIPIVDTEHVQCTQEHFFSQEGKRPVQFRIYASLGGLFLNLILGLFAVFFLIISRCSFGRKILRRYPYYCSFGIFDRDAVPDDEGNQNVAFSFHFVAEGWKEVLSEPTDQYRHPPNKRAVFKVSGVDPAYESTSTALVLAALTLLDETHNIPFSGGVLSPGAAFAKTNLIEKLNKNGLQFEIVSTAEILPPPLI